MRNLTTPPTERPITVRTATSIVDLDEALRIRFNVFCLELGAKPEGSYPGGREVDSFDTLPTTFHLLALDDDKVVGTVRLLVQNLEVARRTGTKYGLDIETLLDFDGLPEASVASLPRSSILPEYRGSSAMACLYREAFELATSLGVTHVMAVGQTGTTESGDAHRLYAHLASSPDRVHPSVTARWLAAEEPIPKVKRLEHPESAHGTPLGIYVRAGARMIGPPGLWAGYYYVPICVDLGLDAERILSLFGRRTS